MPIKLEFTEDDGQRYNSLGDMVTGETEKMIATTISEIERAIASQRCNVHRQNATAQVERTADGWRFNIETCCDDLLAQAERAVASAS